MKTVRWLMVVGMVAGGMGTAASAQQDAGSAGAAKPMPAATAGEYDFGDFSSETLATKSWQALDAKDYAAVEAYAKKCLSLYEQKALEQQASLMAFAPKEKAFNYWALNDVGTCYFILGESLMAQQRYKDAKAAFERVVNDFGFTQCWDPQGWFWKVATASVGRLNKIRAEAGG